MTNAYCDGGGDNVHQTYFYGSYVVDGYPIERNDFTTRYPKVKTTNMAEYQTLVLLLAFIESHRALGQMTEEILIHSDSQLMVKQINQEQRIYSEKLMPYYIDAVIKLAHLENVKLMWVPRKEIVKVLGH